MLKWLRDLVALVLVPVVVVLALLAPAYVTRRVNDVQLEVVCEVARASQAQVQALRAIAHELGLPAILEVPSLPDACVGR